MAEKQTLRPATSQQREIREAIAHIKSDRKDKAIEILEGLGYSRDTRVFTLTVLPNGKTILSTEDALDTGDAERIMAAFMNWREKANDIMLLGNTRVLTVLDIKLELPQGMKA